jgi:hypothetical protein
MSLLLTDETQHLFLLIAVFSPMTVLLAVEAVLRELRTGGLQVPRLFADETQFYVNITRGIPILKNCSKLFQFLRFYGIL